MQLIRWKTFRDPIFDLLFVANLIHPLTLSNPMTFGPEFSEALKYSDMMGSMLLAVTSGVGVPARLLNGFVADIVGHQNMLLAGTIVYALVTWCLWLPAAQTSSGGLWIGFCMCYGFVNGAFNTVVNSVQRRLFGDEMYYPSNGAMTSMRGIGYIIGVPIAGALVSRVTDTELVGRDFTRPIVYTGGLLTTSVACLVGVRWLDARKKGWRWVQ